MSNNESLGTQAVNGLFYQPQIIDERTGVFSGMRNGKGI
jgi:hypothetical protein